MPWIHLHVGDDGIVKACCVANIPFGNINSDSLESIWNSTSINNLRAKFAQGEIDKRCATCYKLEEGGATSIRQETHKNYKDTPIDYQNSTPIYFDIRFSNVCNLKCRTCWHGASSSWFEEAKKLKTNKGQKAIIKNVSDFNLFIRKTGRALLNAKEIYLAGGEPLVMEEHYLLLNWLIENEVTDVKLRYNTNFTTLTYKGNSILDLWAKFEHVEVLASIDANNDLASYIRSNSNWNTLLYNTQLSKKLPHLTFQIAPTISVLNIEHLPELISNCIQAEMITEDDIYINILERPIHYNIQVFPAILKYRITSKLEEFRINLTSAKLKGQITEILTYMNSKDLSSKWSKFKLNNEKLDHLRFETLALDYYEIN